MSIKFEDIMSKIEDKKEYKIPNYKCSKIKSYEYSYYENIKFYVITTGIFMKGHLLKIDIVFTIKEETEKSIYYLFSIKEVVSNNKNFKRRKTPMKKIFILIYSIFSISVLAEYYKKGNEVYYEDYDHKKGKFIDYNEKVENIDLNSLEQINDFYARDKNNVYFRGKETDIDRDYIQIIRLNLVKDRDFVYYEDKKLKVSPRDFSFVNKNVTNKSLPDINVGYGFYVKDFQNAFYVKIDEDRNIEEIKLDDADVDKLVSWNHILAKDGKNIYYYGKKIDYIDALSFDGNGIGYGKDKNNIYYDVTIVKNADYKSFKEIKGYISFAKDKYNVFYEDKIIEGADIKSFEPLKNGFSKDKYSYFYKEQRLEGINYEEIKDFINSFGLDDKKVPGYKYK